MHYCSYLLTRNILDDLRDISSFFCNSSLRFPSSSLIFSFSLFYLLYFCLLRIEMLKQYHLVLPHLILDGSRLPIYITIVSTVYLPEHYFYEAGMSQLFLPVSVCLEMSAIMISFSFLYFIYILRILVKNKH